MEPILDYQSNEAPGLAARVRFAGWVALVAILLAGGVGWLGLLFSHGYSVSGLALFVGWVGLGLAVVAMAVLLATTPADAIRLPARVSVAIILAGAALLHGAALVMVAPELSEDAFRYRLDARLASAGLSPWVAPEHGVLAGRSSRDELAIDLLTPHAYLGSIYPPGAQVVFRAAAWLGPKLRPNGRVWYALDSMVSWQSGAPMRHVSAFAPGMRVLATASALGVTAVLLIGLRAVGRSPWYAVLWAWNPLVVIESAVQSHVDVFGALFLSACVVLAVRHKWWTASIALAVAAGFKPHVLLVAPVLLWLAMTSSGGGWRVGKSAVAAMLLAGEVVLLYAPLIASPESWRGWTQSAAVYAASWEANGFLYELFTAAFRSGDGEQLETAKLVFRLLGALITFAALYLVIRLRLPLADAAYWLTLAPLLVSPVVYPWYLLWPLAVVALLQRSNGWTALVWAATAGLSYQLLREPTWRLPWPWLIAEYVPVLIALTWELRELAQRHVADRKLPLAQIPRDATAAPGAV